MRFDPRQWSRRLGGLSGWRRWLTAMSLGALAAAAMPPVGLVVLLVPAFSGIVWLVGDGRWRGALSAGWWFGTGHFAAGLYWVASAFFVEASVYGWLAPFAVLGLATGLALFTALTFAAAQEISRRLRLAPWARVVTLAVAWTVGEWLRGHVFTGFPWNLMGSVWAASDAVLQTAAWTGVFGLSLLTVAAAALPAVLADGLSVRRVALASSGLVLFAGLWGAGALRLAGADGAVVEGVRLRLVQPNIAQRLKWKPELRIEHVRRQMEMSRQASADGPAPTHVIWAETAVPFNLAADPPLRKALGSVVPEGGLLITGAPRAVGKSGVDRQIWNSLHAVTPAGEIVATYDKQHLVPFGEYVPLRSILRFSKLTAGRLDFSPGRQPRILDMPGLPPAAALICYEVIFPDEILGLGPGEKKRPAWILNLTNDAWFGVSAGPYQHLAAVRLRAAEQGLPVARAANTGISAVIDPYGRVVKALPLDTVGILDADLPQALPATVFARFGEYMTWTIILAAFLGAAGFGRAKRRASARGA